MLISKSIFPFSTKEVELKVKRFKKNHQNQLRSGEITKTTTTTTTKRNVGYLSFHPPWQFKSVKAVTCHAPL